MTKDVITCGINARSDELMITMTQYKIRHIPIEKNNTSIPRHYNLISISFPLFRGILLFLCTAPKRIFL